MSDSYQNPYVVVANSPEAERSQFIRRVYMHLALAIMVFTGIEAALLHSPLAAPLTGLLTTGKYGWLIVLGVFMGVSWIASSWAQSNTSKGMQYLGLGLYVVAEAIIFVPLLYIAERCAKGPVISQAAMLTIGLFLGLTAIVMLTKVDFSFLRGVLMIGGFLAIGFIIASIIFGFNFSLLFATLMVGFAGASILYNTSAIFRQYGADQYVAASLSLFASVALLFWYILQIFIMRRD
ncbi:MAG: Bax inhibitor-1 family protein [Chthoniobacterales bacterium]